jgi:hypothetical protein
MGPTGMKLCIQTDHLKKQGTIAGTLAKILQDLGATLWILKYHRMCVMCGIVKNQVSTAFINNNP